MQLKGEYVHLTFDDAFLIDLANEVKLIMGFVWVNAGRFKKLVCKVKWAASIVPYFKSSIMPLWATTTDAPGRRDREKLHTSGLIMAALLYMRGAAAFW